MATKKTTTTKRKSAVKTTPKRAKSSPKRAKAPVMRSFRVAQAEAPFFTFKLTKQTLYWLVLSAVVVAFTLWILKLQSDIEDIYNSIDATNNAVIEVPQTHHKKR